MRIISDFSDYYDCIMKYGTDKSIAYMRKSEVVDTGNNAFKNDNKAVFDMISSLRDIYLRKIKDRDKGNKYVVFNAHEKCSAFFIIVCDTCYTGVEYDNIYFYDDESLNNYIKGKGLEISKGVVWEFFKEEKPTSYFNKINIGYDFSIKFRSPIFVYARGADELSFEYKLVKDTYLRKYQFYKVQEPQIIFQNIQQFISGILVNPDKSDIIIPDELKIQAHGFDKQSFRKRKS